MESNKFMKTIPLDDSVNSSNNVLNLANLVAKLHHDAIGTSSDILDVIVGVVGFRDMGSGEHMKRTRTLTEILILAMLKNPIFAKEFEEIDYKTIIQASPLHDIGKVGIVDDILLKEERLTDEERKIINKHTLIGCQIVDTMHRILEPKYLKCCRDICLYHHEWFDGTGYPCGLKGYDIPFSARILAIVDVYDALTSARPYKKAMSHDNAMVIITDGMGTQFDPNITKVFLELNNLSSIDENAG